MRVTNTEAQTTEIEQLAQNYPHLATAFSTIPHYEAHLQRLQDLNNAWQQMLQIGATREYTEVIVTEERPGIPDINSFDIIYAGGGLNLLNAAVMTQCYGLRVLVFDRFTVGAVHREWNISRSELQELITTGLLTAEELETVIQREYDDGIVRFHADNIQVPAAELHLKDVLNIAVDAEKLTTLCMRKIQGQATLSGLPNLVLHNTTFQLCAVQPEQGVTVDVVDKEGQQHSYGARLLIDGMGSTSPIACQLNCGRPYSLVCPTVGTVARGYKIGKETDAVDLTIGEVLVSTEDARKNRQLIWETFPGKDDQVAIYLFYYAETGSHVDLLELFDDFFALLPDYKDVSTVEIVKPVYGFIPAGYNVKLPWQKEQKILAYDRVLSLGDAAAFQSPLTFCGFGSYVRNLKRITSLLQVALAHNRLQAKDLNRIRAEESVPALSRAFSKFMIAKASTHKYQEPQWQVNETMNVFCRVLNDLGPRATNAFFKDHVGWMDYTLLVLKTPLYYPQIFALTLRTLTLPEILGWITAWLQLGRQSFIFNVYHLIHPVARSLPGKWLISTLYHTLPDSQPGIMRWREAMEQMRRSRKQPKARHKKESRIEC